MSAHRMNAIDQDTWTRQHHPHKAVNDYRDHRFGGQRNAQNALARLCIWSLAANANKPIAPRQPIRCLQPGIRPHRRAAKVVPQVLYGMHSGRLKTAHHILRELALGGPKRPLLEHETRLERAA